MGGAKIDYTVFRVMLRFPVLANEKDLLWHIGCEALKGIYLVGKGGEDPVLPDHKKTTV